MLTTLIGSLITALIKLIPEDIVRSSLDKFLDVVEDKIAASPSKVDDMALPLIAVLRKQIGIEETAGSKYEDKK